MSTINICKNCSAFILINNSDVLENMGYCKKNPPTAVKYDISNGVCYGRWPVVNAGGRSGAGTGLPTPVQRKGTRSHRQGDDHPGTG